MTPESAPDLRPTSTEPAPTAGETGPTKQLDDQFEAEIQAKGLTAPRVTPADVEANIASEHYFTADDGASHAHIRETMTTSPEGVSCVRSFTMPPLLELLTFCVLILRNGTKIVGINYGAIDPAQHDAARGRAEARADAVRQVWPLLGYALRERLAAAAIQDQIKSEAVKAGVTDPAMLHALSMMPFTNDLRGILPNAQVENPYFTLLL